MQLFLAVDWLPPSDFSRSSVEAYALLCILCPLLLAYSILVPLLASASRKWYIATGSFLAGILCWVASQVISAQCFVDRADAYGYLSSDRYPHFYTHLELLIIRHVVMIFAAALVFGAGYVARFRAPTSDHKVWVGVGAAATALAGAGLALAVLFCNFYSA